MEITQKKEDRQKIWDKYKGIKNGPMKRMFLEYDRYFEAELIKNALMSMHVDFKNLRVLDYGCGVADYGIYFARLKSAVCLYDIDDEALEFAKFRFEKEGLNAPVIDGIMRNHDLIIFGEVLDHLPDPLGTIKEAVDGGVRFIFTSSYPYRSDDPNDVHWKHDHHPKSAFEQQRACQLLLGKNYRKLNFGGQRNLWFKEGTEN